MASPNIDPRTQRLLQAPLLPMLLRMAAPNLLVMLAQASTGLTETYFIGKLGTEALAGVAMVFPGVMLMQMMSAGGMGGGISSAIARALGGNRRDDARAYVAHALIICLVFGACFTLADVTLGAALYRGLGGSGESLRVALTYSHIVFAGAMVLWVMNGLASIIRGTGNMMVPAIVICVGAVLLVPLSPCLIFGYGPFPRLGVAGGALALLTYNVISAVVLALYLWSPRGLLRPDLLRTRLRRALFLDIIRVGGVAVLINIQTNATVAMATSLVGRYGAPAIAGYGTGARLEYLLVPLVFGFGAPLVAIVGTCLGAGQSARAIRAAWLGAAIAFLMCETIGLLAAAFPLGWLGLFGQDPDMLSAGAAYLRVVGPFYGLFGIGMALYFASQGAGRLMWPLLAGLLRMLVAIGAGWTALDLGFGLTGVFLSLGLALAVFGLVNAGAMLSGAWFVRPRPVAALQRRSV